MRDAALMAARSHRPRAHRQGSFLCTKFAGQRMRDAGSGGRIINVGSGCDSTRAAPFIFRLPSPVIHRDCCTKIVEGWPKFWANFGALIGIFSQSVGPSLAIWANPVQFSFCTFKPSRVRCNNRPTLDPRRGATLCRSPCSARTPRAKAGWAA